MADAQTTTDLVAGLVDIPLPREVSLWPQTWEARLAVGILVAAMIATLWHVVRTRRTNRYRREALAELSRIECAREARSDVLSRLALLVRRTALAAFPRERVAHLLGPAWLAFLDRSYGGREFSDGAGRLLAGGPYRQLPPDDAELRLLAALIRHWIGGHHA